MNETTKEVYKAIVAVAGALAKEGIAKDKTCTQGASYKFRGIDDVYNALAPYLAAHNLCILPRMLQRECVERISKSGGALFYTTVTAEFDFVSAVDGSLHTVGPMYGEAMDSGDKGTNKAMSAAYKYAAFQAFCIPTEGDNDTENKTHEVQPGKTVQSPSTHSPPPASTDCISEPQRKMIFAKMKSMGLEPDELKAKFGVASSTEIKKSQMNDVLQWIDGKATA
jgi:hypothetical protein